MPALRNTRHEAFALALAKGMSAIQAYQEAGYRPDGGNAVRLTGKDSIQERVLDIQRAAIPEMEATVERVVTEMMRMAFYNPVEIIKVLGAKLVDLTALEKLPEDLQRCICEITPVRLGEETHYRVKFANKQAALDSIARHLQMFKDTVVVENVFKLILEMPDDELDRRLAELADPTRDETGLNLDPGKGPKTVH